MQVDDKDKDDEQKAKDKAAMHPKQLERYIDYYNAVQANLLVGIMELEIKYNIWWNSPSATVVLDSKASQILRHFFSF